MLRLENVVRNAKKIANEAIRLEATSLIEFYGDAAFSEACERARRAQAKGDRRKRLIWAQVALRVYHRAFGDLPALIVQAGSEQPGVVCKLRQAPKGKRRRSGAKQEIAPRGDAKSRPLNLAAAERRRTNGIRSAVSSRQP